MMKIRFVAYAVAVSVAANATRGDSAERVAVTLQSGRIFKAYVDPATDDERLWLHWGDKSASIRRPILWDRVVSVAAAGGDLTAEQFRAVATEYAEPLAPPTQRIPLSQPAPQSVPQPPVVRSIAADGWLANWDADPEQDGLVAAIFALDEFGYAVVAEGTLEAELFLQPAAAMRRGESATSAGRWVVPIWAADYGPDGALARLPFQAIHPEFETRFRNAGALRLRFTAPGSGTFDATLDWLRVRPSSPFRDRLQQATGSRFLPAERLGRPRLVDPAPPRAWSE